jgi:aspartyl-tRNA(Asn)/glutamyl-tRNA(Gln) amidotransferase subunit A
MPVLLKQNSKEDLKLSLFDLKLQEVHNKLHNKELTVTDLVEQSYSTIGTVNSKVKAFLSINEEQARASAKKLDEQPNETRVLLFGLPAGIKDNIATEVLPTP